MNLQEEKPVGVSPLRWVLLPGMDGTGELFRPFLSVLPATTRPLVISYPTHEKRSYEELEQLVWNSLPDEPFILIAESFSGPIAVQIAQRCPPKLSALILCSTFVQFPAGKISCLCARAAGPFVFNCRPPRWLLSHFLLEGGASELELLLLASIAKNSSDVMAFRWKSIREVDARESLRRLTIPILALIGTRDRLVARRNAESMRQLNDRVLVNPIDGPHLLLQTKPHAALALIQRFLAQERS